MRENTDQKNSKYGNLLGSDIDEVKTTEVRARISQKCRIVVNNSGFKVGIKVFE